MWHQYLSAVDGDLFFNYPSVHYEPIVRDTLFRITGSELDPVLRVNYGQRGRYHRLNNQGWTILNGYIFLPSPISMLNGRFLTANFLQASETRGGGSHRYEFWYDFVTGKQYLLRGGFTDNVYQTGQVLLQRFGLLSGKLYFYKWPHELDESPLEREDEDNPIVFIVTLKE